MAYKSRIKQHSSYSIAFDNLCTFLGDIGWEEHDVVTSTNKVYKTNGETGNFAYGYMRVWLTSSQICFEPWLYWNASTHAGLCKGYISATYQKTYLSLTVDDDYLCMYGSKDLVVVYSKINDTASYQSIQMFGHFPKSLSGALTTLTSSGAVGDNVNIAVDSSSSFVKGVHYQIVGADYEGRDWISIQSIPDSTHLIINNLPRGYSIGSKIGTIPCPFGGTFGNNDRRWFFPVCFYNHVGTEDATSLDYASMTVNPFMQAAGTNLFSDPDNRSDRYILTPLFFGEYNYSTIFGYSDENILTTPVSVGTADNYNIYGITNSSDGFESGTAESGTSTTITDDDKAWANDEWAGKYVTVVEGTGVNQVREVESNTSITITISGAEWNTNPDSTSQYYVVDEAYRKLGYFACKEVPR